MYGVIGGEETGVAIRYLTKNPEQWSFHQLMGKGCRGGSLGVRRQKLISRLAVF